MCGKVCLSWIPKRPLPSNRSANLTGFVLAGGASRRMGRAKQSLQFSGEPMLDRQIRLLRPIARRVAIVGGSPGYVHEFDVPCIPDVVTGCGPLGGIYTALLESRTEFNLVLGCDLPFVTRNLLACLILRARAEGNDVTVPRSQDGRLQPLCAVYRRRALYAVRTRLALGQNKLSGFFPMVHFAAIPWRDLAGAGVQPSEFENVNTPQDYEHARSRIEGPAAGVARSKRTPV